MNFRVFQGLTTGTMMLYWAVRFAQNPGHFHPVMLCAAVAIAVVSELSYRAGKKESSVVKQEGIKIV